MLLAIEVSFTDLRSVYWRRHHQAVESKMSHGLYACTITLWQKISKKMLLKLIYYERDLLSKEQAKKMKIHSVSMNRLRTFVV